MKREDLPQQMRPESMFGKPPNEAVPVVMTRAEWALVGLILTEHANDRRFRPPRKRSLSREWRGLILEVADEIRQSMK